MNISDKYCVCVYIYDANDAHICIYLYIIMFDCTCDFEIAFTLH